MQYDSSKRLGSDFYSRNAKLVAQKLLGWFGGHGIEGTGGFFESVGFTPGKRNATLAGLAAPTVIVAHGITLRVLCALALGRDLGEAEHLAVPQGSVARIAGGQIALFTSGR